MRQHGGKAFRTARGNLGKRSPPEGIHFRLHSPPLISVLAGAGKQPRSEAFQQYGIEQQVIVWPIWKATEFMQVAGVELQPTFFECLAGGRLWTTFAICADIFGNVSIPAATCMAQQYFP